MQASLEDTSFVHHFMIYLWEGGRLHTGLHALTKRMAPSVCAFGKGEGCRVAFFSHRH